MSEVKSYFKAALIVCLLCVFSVFIYPAIGSADGQQIPEVNSRAVIEPTLDPRLPPVIPGQEVIRNGKKIKVWSTAGSPSVGANYEQQQDWTAGSGLGENPSIIVDGRREVRAPLRHRR